MAVRELPVRGSNDFFPKAAKLAAAVLLGSAVMLGGCSGRDTVTAERLAQVTDAAMRAEKAADRAEAAANKVAKADQPIVVEADPDETGDPNDAPDTAVIDPDDQAAAETQGKT